MPNKHILERIGRRLREVSAVDEQLPEQWSRLIGHLAKLEQHRGQRCSQRERK
jgi:hypothetical protein